MLLLTSRSQTDVNANKGFYAKPCKPPNVLTPSTQHKVDPSRQKYYPKLKAAECLPNPTYGFQTYHKP